MTDNDKTRYRQLLRAIAGDPWLFRGVRECGTCEGSGGNDKPPGRTTVDSCHCTACKGHGTVFREWVTCPACNGQTHPGDGHGGCDKCKGEGRIPDEAGRAVIAEAVEVWAEQKKGKYLTLTRYGGASELWEWANGRARIPAFFEDGEKAPDDLFDFVRNYEADPEDLLANDGAALKAALREAAAVDEVKITLSGFGCSAMVWIYDDTRNRPYNAQADTEAAALLAAVEAAIAAKGGDA